MYPKFVIALSQAAYCLSFAEYEIFPGFDETINVTRGEPTTPSATTVATTTAPNSATIIMNLTYQDFSDNMTKVLVPQNSTTTKIPNKFKCPEEERPFNIGPYEVPTQWDLALLTRKTLKRMFGSYHQKALIFLDDIKKATRATVQVEQKCPNNIPLYKQCVKHVSSQCENIIKSLVISLENQRHDVEAFTESSICRFSQMKDDALKLIKILAMEEASISFALPAFLRLLGACINYCNRTSSSEQPQRKMTDTDLVVQHFLTLKDYHPMTPTTKVQRRRNKIFLR